MELKDIVEELKKEGFSNATANYHGKKVFAENYGKNADKYTHKEKEWANQHGFTAEEVRFLGLNDENYTKYLSSYDYHLLDPIDPFTKRLVDGKLVIPFTIGGRYPEYLPKYYCWVFDENTVIPMNDNPVVAWNSVKDYLIQLLDKVGILAIKPYTGGGGIGFIKLEKICNHYYSNGEKVIDLQEVVGLIKNKYIVTEYVRQCKEFDDVWKDSAATLRVVTINKNNKQISFVTYVRFGTKISKGACNLTSGGVAVPFNWENGEYYDRMYRYIDYCDDEKFILTKHPDSSVSLAGKRIPHFDMVKKLVKDICSFLTVHTYFGFDIIITDDGVKLCEINSHPSLDYEQLMFGGVWEQTKEVQDFFRELIENRKKRSAIYCNKQM